MTYKVVSFTPKGEVQEVINRLCRKPWLPGCYLPQDLARLALFNEAIISKEQIGGAALVTSWRPGDSVKVSLWKENHLDLAAYAAEHGVSKQLVIEAAIMNYVQREGL